MGESNFLLGLDPDQIVRRAQGPRYFGLKKSQLAEAIKDGKIPAPFPLVEGGRATGWLGRQIIAHHHRRIAAQLELSGPQRAHEQKKAAAKAKTPPD
jgi:predicted DNA-binding transcriptional regulator AlpA